MLNLKLIYMITRMIFLLNGQHFSGIKFYQIQLFCERLILYNCDRYIITESTTSTTILTISSVMYHPVPIMIQVLALPEHLRNSTMAFHVKWNTIANHPFPLCHALRLKNM